VEELDKCCVRRADAGGVFLGAESGSLAPHFALRRVPDTTLPVGGRLEVRVKEGRVERSKGENSP
jgi:hypothetical protein